MMPIKLLGFRVSETCQRLVQQQDARLAGQSPRQLHQAQARAW
jgi:hypothetical protein